MQLNKAWHLANKMPAHPTMEQRIAWHTAHALHCRCREIPPALKAEIKKRSLKTQLI